ncbi:MAG: hypothetical protein P9L98_05230 [Candidatus Kaelpia imicola]|nr:hypothetical protein [Candidatus Kaelpia imicola]
MKRISIIRIILIFLALGLFIPNISFARRVREVLTQVDNFGTVTYYESYNGNFRPLKIVDKLGHVLDEYYYRGSELDRVITTNLETGEKLELRIKKVEGRPGLQADIYIEQKYVGFREWEINEGWIILGDITIDEGMRKNGIGLTVSNWIVAYSNMVEGVTKATTLSQNPLIISIMQRVTKLETVSYAQAALLGIRSLGTNLSNTDLIKSIESFSIGNADNLRFGVDMYRVIFDDSKVFSSNYPSLPVGTELDNFEVLGDWIVKLDGVVIGQIKSFCSFLCLGGEINPIHVFIDEEGKVVQY